MRGRKILPAILVLIAIPTAIASQDTPGIPAQRPAETPSQQSVATTTAQQPMTASEVVDKIVSQEQGEGQLLRQYSPLVETYIQNDDADKQFGVLPDGNNNVL